jgi:hypothetical protein
MKCNLQLAAISCIALALAGCHHRHSSKPRIASGLVGEVEPNDSAFNANYLGHLYGGDGVRVLGRISAADLYDGFAFVAGEPLSVRFVLRADDPGADLDVCVYDPYIDDFVLCFEDPLDPEVGSFDVLDAGAEFHIVVTPFAGVSDYELEIVATCCALAPALQAGPSQPEDSSTSKITYALELAPSQSAAVRLEAYRKAGEVLEEEEEEQEQERVPGVLIEIDDSGSMEATEFDLSAEGELRVRAGR